MLSGIEQERLIQHINSIFRGWFVYLKEEALTKAYSRWREARRRLRGKVIGATADAAR